MAGTKEPRALAARLTKTCWNGLPGKFTWVIPFVFLDPDVTAVFLLSPEIIM